MAENDFSSIFSKITENPDTVMKIMEIAASLKKEIPVFETEADEKETSRAAEKEIPKYNRQSNRKENEPSLSFALSSPPKKDASEELFKALKPYLGVHRREKIDKILSLWRIIRLFGAAKD